MSNAVDQALEFRKQQLQVSSLRLELPTDHSRSAAQGYRRATCPIDLSRALSENLEGFCRRESVPLSVLLLSALKILLYRYTSQEDIVVGSLSAQPSQGHNGNPTGIFDNTLVLRTNLSGLPTFRELLVRVLQVVLAVTKHRDLLHENMLKELQPEPNHTPLPQVMFIYQDGSNAPLRLPNQTATHMNTDEQTAQVDLTLLINKNSNLLNGLIAYNSNLFEPATITRLIGHFETLLTAIVAQPDCSIASLPILSATEQHQLLVEWNSTQITYPSDATIVQLFEAQTKRTPDAIALIHKDQQLSYRELNQQANQLAHYLKRQGVGPEVPVGICLDRSLEMVIGMLGILKAGGAYIPLDPSYPPARLAFMLKDAAPPFLLTQAHLMKNLPPLDAQTIALDSQWDTIAGEGTENPETNVTPGNLAYIIYTSGSTGKPKGVMIPHHAICNHMFWLQSEFTITHQDRILQKTPFSFDAAVWEFYAPLFVGGQLIMAEPEGHRDGHYLAQTIIQHKITVLQLVPSQLKLLLATSEFSHCSSLRTIFCGGEPLPAMLVNQCLQQLPTAELYNLYGPSEATIDTTFWPCKPLPPQASVPIGRPIANVQTYILDGHLEPVPIGVPGELYIGGAGVGRGYLNRPELTAESFIQDPFSENPESRLYKTGDMGRYRTDGNIEFLGRVDNQVKVRGFRIELGEIEAVLRQHPAVKEVVVLAREDRPGEKRLVAYLVLKDVKPPKIGEWRHFVSQKLPVNMIPAAFVILTEFPITPNGKLDRRALPTPELDRSILNGHYVAPRTVAEETIANIWAEILKLETVGIHDNFFELGGDSILSIQITSKANQAGIYLTPDQIFHHPTIAQLASIAGTAPVVQAEQDLVIGSLPLTPIQQWFFEQDLPEYHHWNQAFLLEVRQALNPSLLEQAEQHLLTHHDALRLRFTPENSGWQQVIASTNANTSFSRVDLSTLEEAEQAAAIQSAAAELQASLDLSEGPLARMILFERGPLKSSYLLIIIHHLVVDSVSWRILLEDLGLIYQQLRREEVVQLPPKTTSYKQWAQRLAEYAQSDSLTKELPYWLEIHNGQPARLPIDFPQGITNNTEASANIVSVSINVDETEALLKEVPKTYQTQVTDVLLTALSQTFTQWTGSPKLLIDLKGHGREAIFEGVDLLRTVGWFTTIFPTLLSLEDSSNPGEMLKAIKEKIRRIPNRGIGYGLLRYLSGNTEAVKKLESLPHAELSFDYQGQFDQILPPGSPFKFTNQSCGPTRSLRGNRQYLLEIEGSIVERRLQVRWIYSQNVHAHSTIEKLAQNFMNALEGLIVHCQSPGTGGYTPSDFPEADLSQQELDDLLAEINEL